MRIQRCLRSRICSVQLPTSLVPGRRRWWDRGIASMAEEAIAHPQHPNVVDVQELAQAMRKEVRDYTSQASTRPKLVGIMTDRSKFAGNPTWRQDEDDAEIYSTNIEETLAEDGLEYEVVRCSSATVMDVEQAIRQTNARSDVHGILVFYPIFKRDRQFASVLKSHGPYLNPSTGVFYKTQDDYLRDIVSPEKDVEALGTGHNARWLFRARKQLSADPYIPCTVQAVLKILETYHAHDASVGVSLKDGLAQRWTGLTATVINRSEILGRPLAALMALQGANVFSVDESSVLQFLPGGRLRRCHQTLQDCLEQSSIVVTAVPSPTFTLRSDSIQEGTTVVNVAEHSNVDEKSLLERPNVKLVTQVGSCTVAALEQNLIRLHSDHVARR